MPRSSAVPPAGNLPSDDFEESQVLPRYRRVEGVLSRRLRAVTLVDAVHLAEPLELSGAAVMIWDAIAVPVSPDELLEALRSTATDVSFTALRNFLEELVAVGIAQLA